MAALAAIVGMPMAMALSDLSLTTYEKGMDQVNAAIAGVIAGQPLPITDVDLAFGTTRDGSLPLTVADSGKNVVFLESGLKIDPLASGATYQEDTALIEAGTYLGGMGFYLGHSQAVTATDVAAVLTDCSLTFSRADLIGAGVSVSQVEWLFDVGNSETDVRDEFFSEFTYFKVFEGADPAIPGKDIVAFLMDPAQGLVAFPDFVVFVRTLDPNPANDTIKVGIRYFLLDDAPVDPAQPFVLNKDKSWVLSTDGSTNISMVGVLFIYDGNRDGEFRDPVLLMSLLEPLANTAVGGSFPVTAENVTLLEFTAKDKFFAEYYDPIKDPAQDKLKKAAVKLAQKVDWTEDNGIVNLLWNKKIVLFNRKEFKAWMKGGGVAIDFLEQDGVQVPLQMPLKTVNKGNVPAERALGLLTLRPPEIDGLGKGGELGTLVILGTWFGTKKPKVWLEYQVGEPAVTKAKMLKVLKPTDLNYVDAKGKPSYMNAADGISQVIVVFSPELVPVGSTGFLVLDNGVGLTVYSFDK
jgi:hypothetical protein